MFSYDFPQHQRRSDGGFRLRIYERLVEARRKPLTFARMTKLAAAGIRHELLPPQWLTESDGRMRCVFSASTVVTLKELADKRK